MTYSFPFKSVIAALAMMLLSVATAKAEIAVVSTDLNLRGGPGIEYPIVVTMHGGSTADVRECYDGWCRVLWRGYEGFASEAYLDFGGYGRGYAYGYVTPRPPVVAVRPYFDYGPRVYHRGYHKKRYVKRRHYNKRHYKNRRHVKRKHYNRGHGKRTHVRSNRRENVDHLGNRVQLRPDGSSRVIVRNVDQGK